MIAPLVLVIVADAARQADPEAAARRNGLYADAVHRHGGRALVLDATASAAARRSAFDAMAGLMLTGGADIDPGRYGELPAGASEPEPHRDELEAEAWSAAQERGVPVLGLCRGMQAMNVFAGGRLLQHVDGHRAAGHGPTKTHPLRVLPGTRLARILFPTNVGGGVLSVNSYHHQAIRAGDLAPGYLPGAVAPSPVGDLVEAMETASGPLRIAVQCHPERRESTPAAFERLFAFFVASCRGPAAAR